MIWSNEDNLIMYVGEKVRPDVFDSLVYVNKILTPLVDVVGLTCGTLDSSRLYFIQGKDMKIRELTKATYHKNSKHITIEAPFKIYTTDKKALFDYYKKQFHKGIQYLSDICYTGKDMQKYREIKVNAMNIYRQTIETIKKL